MSQASQDNPKPNNMCGVYGGQKFRRGFDRDNPRYMPPYNNFQYHNSRYNFHPRWNYRKRKPQYRPHRQQQQQQKRAPSPFSGTEEYAMKKIQEASDMIKKKLMMPEADDLVNIPEATTRDNVQEPQTEPKSSKGDGEKSSLKNNKKAISYNVGEIQQKILTHITKLSHGKKVNLICSNPSGYDVVIEQIQKQKRLELSKALRDMCENQGVENSEVIHSIIPDIGIKIEDLPLEVIQELSSTLDWHFNDLLLSGNNETVNVKTEVLDDAVILVEEDEPVQSVQNTTLDLEIKDDPFVTQIKQEIIDIEPDPEIKSEVHDDTEEHPDFGADETENANFILENQLASNTEVTLSPQNVNSNTNTVQETVVISKETVSVGVQTDLSGFSSNSVSIQTNSASDNDGQFYVDADNVHNLDDAVQSMLAIDKEVARLTKMRQDIFAKLQSKQVVNSGTKRKITKAANVTKSPQKPKKPKSHDEDLTRVQAPEGAEDDIFDVLVKEEVAYYDKILEFERISEKILVIRVVNDTILAGSESGKIFFINILDGSSLGTLNATSAPITSLCHWSGKQRRLHLIVGSSDTKMHEFDYSTRLLVRVTQLKHRVQCMEIAWDYAFIGTVDGNLLRYSLKLCKVEFKENISLDSVMVLKATQEGARRVLLVGMRNAAVTVRDAMSGLHLRTMNELVTPTVYSLVLENSKVYCGTTVHDILVFSFHDGNLVHKYQATNSRGVSCMKIVDNLLFVSCYNGNIYVYNVKTNKHVGLIEGPGGVILSMEILKNIVIVGTMSSNFATILIPNYILEYNTIKIT